MEKIVVFVAHCILNQNAKAMGFAKFPGIFDPLTDSLKKMGCVIEQLPCPETLHMGIKRWWCTKDLYDNPGFRKLCRRLAKATADLMEYYVKRGFSIIVIGVDGSPSCGVNLTCRNSSWGGKPGGEIGECGLVEEMGVWMEELLKETRGRNLNPAFTGFEEELSKMDEFLRKFEMVCRRRGE